MRKRKIRNSVYCFIFASTISRLYLWIFYFALRLTLSTSRLQCLYTAAICNSKRVYSVGNLILEITRSNKMLLQEFRGMLLIISSWLGVCTLSYLMVRGMHVILPNGSAERTIVLTCYQRRLLSLSLGFVLPFKVARPYLFARRAPFSNRNFSTST